MSRDRLVDQLAASRRRTASLQTKFAVQHGLMQERVRCANVLKALELRSSSRAFSAEHKDTHLNSSVSAPAQPHLLAFGQPKVSVRKASASNFEAAAGLQTLSQLLFSDDDTTSSFTSGRSSPGRSSPSRWALLDAQPELPRHAVHATPVQDSDTDSSVPGTGSLDQAGLVWHVHSNPAWQDAASLPPSATMQPAVHLMPHLRHAEQVPLHAAQPGTSPMQHSALYQSNTPAISPAQHLTQRYLHEPLAMQPSNDPTHHTLTAAQPVPHGNTHAYSTPQRVPPSSLLTPARHPPSHMPHLHAVLPQLPCLPHSSVAPSPAGHLITLQSSTPWARLAIDPSSRSTSTSPAAPSPIFHPQPHSRFYLPLSQPQPGSDTDRQLAQQEQQVPAAAHQQQQPAQLELWPPPQAVPLTATSPWDATETGCTDIGAGTPTLYPQGGLLAMQASDTVVTQNQHPQSQQQQEHHLHQQQRPQLELQQREQGHKSDLELERQGQEQQLQHQLQRQQQHHLQQQQLGLSQWQQQQRHQQQQLEQSKWWQQQQQLQQSNQQQQQQQPGQSNWQLQVPGAQAPSPGGASNLPLSSGSRVQWQPVQGGRWQRVQGAPGVQGQSSSRYATPQAPFNPQAAAARHAAVLELLSGGRDDAALLRSSLQLGSPVPQLDGSQGHLTYGDGGNSSGAFTSSRAGHSSNGGGSQGLAGSSAGANDDSSTAFVAGGPMGTINDVKGGVRSDGDDYGRGPGGMNSAANGGSNAGGESGAAVVTRSRPPLLLDMMQAMSGHERHMVHMAGHDRRMVPMAGGDGYTPWEEQQPQRTCRFSGSMGSSSDDDMQPTSSRLAAGQYASWGSLRPYSTDGAAAEQLPCNGGTGSPQLQASLQLSEAVVNGHETSGGAGVDRHTIGGREGGHIRHAPQLDGSAITRSTVATPATGDVAGEAVGDAARELSSWGADSGPELLPASSPFISLSQRPPLECFDGLTGDINALDRLDLDQGQGDCTTSGAKLGLLGMDTITRSAELQIHSWLKTSLVGPLPSLTEALPQDP